MGVETRSRDVLSLSSATIIFVRMDLLNFRLVFGSLTLVDRCFLMYSTVSNEKDTKLTYNRYTEDMTCQECSLEQKKKKKILKPIYI